MISNMIEAIIPDPNKYWKAALIKVPRITIKRASVNFAFSLPTKSLPVIYRTGASRMMLTIICITKASKLITAIHFSLPKLKLPLFTGTA
jgi:hypothetical protein